VMRRSAARRLSPRMFQAPPPKAPNAAAQHDAPHSAHRSGGTFSAPNLAE
jgi:hypothetical protein